MPSPHRKLPRYREIADTLRTRIVDRVLPPGALLPSENDLIGEFRVSRSTVRQAMQVLRDEGLVVTEHGRGTYVRPQSPVRRVSSKRYQEEAVRARSDILEPGTSFTTDHNLPWSAYTLDRQFERAPADPVLAELFGCPPGTPLLVRRFVFRAHGVAQQLSTSCYLWDMVAGTPAADPDREPWPGGNIAQLKSLGVTVMRVVERVRSRMPTKQEAEVLALPQGVPVVTVTRQTYGADDQVVEVAADIVMPADRIELVYRMSEL